MNRLVTSSGRSECHHRCWRQSCKNSFLCGWLLHARILYLWGKEIGSCSGLIVKIWIVGLLWRKSDWSGTCMCEPFQPGSCSKTGAHFEGQTSAFGNPTISMVKKNWLQVVPLLHLYIICPLVKPAFCFRSFCWFLLLLYRLCHFHLLLTEDYLNK